MLELGLIPRTDYAEGQIAIGIAPPDGMEIPGIGHYVFEQQSRVDATIVAWIVVSQVNLRSASVKLPDAPVEILSYHVPGVVKIGHVMGYRINARRIDIVMRVAICIGRAVLSDLPQVDMVSDDRGINLDIDNGYCYIQPGHVLLHGQAITMMKP